MSQFLKSKGDYHNLVVYRKAECIYDITFHFAKTHLSYGDRTVDQMIQAARSGKQNIIEGSAASLTSRETEIKLFNVAKASFDELLADYEDYIRVRGIDPWNAEKQNQVREYCRNHNDSRLYRDIAPQRDAATLANLCITMIHQELYLLLKLIARAQSDFLQNGGIREQMSAARRAARLNPTTPPATFANNGNNGSHGNNGSLGNNVSPANNASKANNPPPSNNIPSQHPYINNVFPSHPTPLITPNSPTSPNPPIHPK